LYELDPDSRAALDEFCADLTPKQADYLRTVVTRICDDPSGHRQPTHSFTRPFHNAERYVGKLPPELKVWELKTNRYRALFYTAEVEKSGTTHRRLVLLPIRGRGKGRRLLHAAEAPWPH
jgi:hypothetical protein